MRSSDDLLGNGQRDAESLPAKPMDRPMPHARARSKGHLRLVHSVQVLGKSHARESRRTRRFVKSQFGEFHGNASRGYHFPMGNRIRATEQAQKMTTGAAIAAALRAVIPRRKISDAEEITKIPHSTLRRLIKGQQNVNADTIDKLRRLPGFSAEFDRLAGTDAPGSDYVEVARRFESSMDPDGAALIAYQVERLARILDPAEIANLLKSEANRLERVVKIAKGGE